MQASIRIFVASTEDWTEVVRTKVVPKAMGFSPQKDYFSPGDFVHLLSGECFGGAQTRSSRCCSGLYLSMHVLARNRVIPTK